MLKLCIQWLDLHAGAIQAISAVIIAVLTFFLVCFTRRYVNAATKALRLATNQLQLVRDQVEQEKNALELTRKQFERDWQPDLRIALVERLDTLHTYARVANLAKPSALITAIRIGAGEGHLQERLTFPRSDLVPGGDARDLPIKTQLVIYRERIYPLTPITGVRPVLQILIGIAFTYDCGSERQVDTPWYDFNVRFQDRDIFEIIPSS